MKKLILLCSAVLVAASAFAQNDVVTKTETVTDKDGRQGVKTTVTEYAPTFKDKAWYVRLNGGITTYRGENEWKAPIGDLIAPAGDISFGRWVNNAIAVDLTLGVNGFKGIAMMDAEQHRRINAGESFDNVMTQYFMTKDVYSSKKYPNEYLYKQKGSYYNIYARVLFDLRTIISGTYNPKRVYGIMPYVGGGWAQGFGKNNSAKSPSFNAGLVNQFKITDRFALELNLAGALLGDSFENEVTNERACDGYASATAGLVFNFGKPKKRVLHENVTVNYVEEKIKEIKGETIREVVPGPSQNVPIKYVVNFVINKTDVVKRELVNLEIIANYIKSTPERKYVVLGYADKQTGNDSINEKLSEGRSENVYKILTEDFGVNPEQLGIEHFGGVDYMFYHDESLSRCAIITDAK